ncbi:hypothetical protein Drorol1_Dr00012200, partial [Drosera rotundifolia]
TTSLDAKQSYLTPLGIIRNGSDLLRKGFSDVRGLPFYGSYGQWQVRKRGGGEFCTARVEKQGGEARKLDCEQSNQEHDSPTTQSITSHIRSQKEVQNPRSSR